MKKLINNNLFTLFFSLFGLLILITLFIIGCNSNYLIEKQYLYIIGLLIICLIIFMIYSIIKIDKKKFKNRFVKFLTSIFVIGFVLCSTFIYLVYINIGFRDWFVTTSIKTLSHQYLAKWFYNDYQIYQVKARNYIKENDMSTDITLEFEKVNSDEEIEKVIMNRKNDELYKVIKFEVNECDAYMTIVYEPSKVGVAVTSKLGEEGENLMEFAKNNNAVIAVNGGGFNDADFDSYGGHPIGVTVVDGEVITNNEYGSSTTGGLIGFNYDNQLVLIRDVTKEKAIEANIRDGLTFGPFLIVNGEAAEVEGNGGWGNAPRTVIGQRADGIVLLLTVDSTSLRTHGAGVKDILKVMQDYGAINAANLDGGSSTALIVNNELINKPIHVALRKLSTAFIVSK